MRVMALLCWYDEPIELLALCIDGLAKAGVCHVVAVDGRYETFPATSDVSHANQRAVIDGACRHHGMASTVLTPNGAWANEAEKRTHLFRMAFALSDPSDWWFNIDADMVVAEAADDFHLQLLAAEQATAMVRVVDVVARAANRPDWPPEFDMRCLFRAAPIAVQGHHYDYVRVDTGEPLWRGADPTGLAEPLDLTGAVVVEHRPASRPQGRILQKNAYYTRRDEEGLEMDKCLRCEEHARHRVYAGLRMVNGTPVGRIEELCDGCAKEQQRIARGWLLQHGLPPDTTFHESYAMPLARPG